MCYYEFLLPHDSYSINAMWASAMCASFAPSPPCALDPRLRVVNASSPRGSFPMAVLSNADLVSHELHARGYWELKYPSRLLELSDAAPSDSLPQTGTFLDIGANLGFYSLLFAHHGFHVLAVEPMLLNRKAITTSLCLNPAFASRVTLLPVALGTHDTHDASPRRTRCVVRADDRNAGNGKLSCSQSESCERPTSTAMSHATICEPVRMSTLDELLQRERERLVNAPLFAVKLDVEGFVRAFRSPRPDRRLTADCRMPDCCLSHAAAHTSPRRPPTCAELSGAGLPLCICIGVQCAERRSLSALRLPSSSAGGRGQP